MAPLIGLRAVRICGGLASRPDSPNIRADLASSLTIDRVGPEANAMLANLFELDHLATRVQPVKAMQSDE